MEFSNNTWLSFSALSSLPDSSFIWWLPTQQRKTQNYQRNTMLKRFLNCLANFTNTNKEKFTSEYESAMKEINYKQRKTTHLQKEEENEQLE